MGVTGELEGYIEPNGMRPAIQLCVRNARLTSQGKTPPSLFDILRGCVFFFCAFFFFFFLSLGEHVEQIALPGGM